MRDFSAEGIKLREKIKTLVLELIESSPECSASADGLRQSEIFRRCGLDWGNYPHATSSNQQYWVVAILRELEKDGKILWDDSKRWHMK